MTKIITKKCPDCGGELVKSKRHDMGEAKYFWAKPWSTKLMEITNLRVFPWACMNCGRVFLYLDEKEYEKVKQEYERRKMTGEV